jgi:hypothetical protein
VIGRIVRRRREAAERGQSLVEMALILPLLVLIVLGTLEFGFAFDHHLTLEYATREGARAGAALAHGGVGPPGCDGADEVDPRIIAAVQRVLTSPGSPVDIGNVAEIRIYNAGVNGEELATNVWRYSAGDGPTVDGLALDFKEFSNSWGACDRNNSAVNTQSVGVALTYTYDLRTPFGYFLGDGLEMTDRTVMQLNPTN